MIQRWPGKGWTQEAKWKTGVEAEAAAEETHCGAGTGCTAPRLRRRPLLTSSLALFVSHFVPEQEGSKFLLVSKLRLTGKLAVNPTLKNCL